MDPFDFPLLVEKDKLDELPEEYRGLYVDKGDEGFKMIEPLAKRVHELGGLQITLKKLRDNEKKLAGELDGFKAIAKTPDEVKEQLEGYKKLGEVDTIKGLLTEREQLLADKPDITKATEHIRSVKEAEIAKLTKQFQDNLTAKDAEIKRTRDALRDEMIDTALGAEIVRHKGIPRLLLPALRSHVRIREEGERFLRQVIDTDGDARVNVKGEPLTLSELVAEAKADSELAYAFEADGRGGSGADPAGGAGGSGRKANKTYKLNEWQALTARAKPEERAALLRDKAAGKIRVVSN